MKVVINKQYGGFSLSPKAMAEFYERKGKKVYFYEQTKYSFRDGKELFVKVSADKGDNFLINGLFVDLGESFEEFPEDNENDIWADSRPEKRDDPDLIATVEKLGSDADGACATLSIVEIPDGTDYIVEEYDGMEWIAERHNTWG